MRKFLIAFVLLFAVSAPAFAANHDSASASASHDRSFSGAGSAGSTASSAVGGQ